MVEVKDVLPLKYYSYGQAFTGSDAGKRYRIIKALRGEDEKKVLQTSVWKEPFCYDKTPKEEILEKDFEYSKEGLSAAVGFINETSV